MKEWENDLLERTCGHLTTGIIKRRLGLSNGTSTDAQGQQEHGHRHPSVWEAVVLVHLPTPIQPGITDEEIETQSGSRRPQDHAHRPQQGGDLPGLQK
jgi:hypothetical protein